MFFKMSKLSIDGYMLGTFAKEDMESCVMQIFDFIGQNKFETYSKVSDVIRSDAIVLRMANINDAKKVINFINTNVTGIPIADAKMIPIYLFNPRTLYVRRNIKY